MIYPVPPRTFAHRRKKKKKKLPWIIVIIILGIAAFVIGLFWRYQNLYQSVEMSYPRVDYVFVLPEQQQVVLIRNDTVRKISYILNLSQQTYDPVLRVHLDYAEPRELAQPLRTLFNPVDFTYYASLKNSDIGRLGSLLSVTDFHLAEEDALVRLLQAVAIGPLEFISFSSTQPIMQFMNNSNLNTKALFRLIDQLRTYAIQIVPVQYQTLHPVTIRLNQSTGTQSVQRYYLDSTHLNQIKEFINP